MKLVNYAIICFLMVASSCKVRHAQTSTPTKVNNTVKQDTTLPYITGIVSHRYQSSGCSPVILCKKAGIKDTLIFIPMTKLGKYDVDGIKISFNYRRLRIHNPKGCKGSPVQISNISVDK